MDDPILDFKFRISGFEMQESFDFTIPRSRFRPTFGV
jgi:hypothetical protein